MTAIIGFVEAEQLLLQHADLPDDSLLWPFPRARLLLSMERQGNTEFELVVRSVIEGVHARLSGGNPAPTAPQETRRSREAASLDAGAAVPWSDAHHGDAVRGPSGRDRSDTSVKGRDRNR